MGFLRDFLDFLNPFSSEPGTYTGHSGGGADDDGTVHGRACGWNDPQSSGRDDTLEEYDRSPPSSDDDDKKGEPGGSWGFR